METEAKATVWSEPAVGPALAATVMQAGEKPGGIGVYIREHPVVLFGVIAALLLIGGVIYVFLAISKPRLVSAPAVRPLLTTPLAVAPAPQSLPPQPTPLRGEMPAESKSSVAELPPEPREPNAVNIRPSSPRLNFSRPSPQQNISVNAARAAPTVNPQLQDAYSALQQNRLDAAQAAYQKVLAAEPNNVDALLGLAAVAEQQKLPDQAVQYYLKVLQIDPKNTSAQAALISLVGNSDPLGAEARLKQLLARDPSAILYFTLGNLYADQAQWPKAQDAYFQAHHLQPDNPDYAFNLAIGLEHLNQPKLALKFYQQALDLAKNKGPFHFDFNLAQSRVARLSSLE